MAEKAAVLLRGKHKAIFTSHVDTGDFVIVINADKAVFTGKNKNGFRRWSTTVTVVDCQPGKAFEIAGYSAAEVERLTRQAVEALMQDATLTGEVLMFSAGPRQERFQSI